MEAPKKISTKYFEAMEERIARLELALLHSKVLPPSLQRSNATSDSTGGIEQAFNNVPLFQQYVDVMERWGTLVSNREEPLLNTFVNKYVKAIGTCTLENKEDIISCLQSSSLDYKQRLTILLNSYMLLLNAVNQLETTFSLDVNFNPPEFRDYVRPLNQLKTLITSFDGFGSQIRKTNQDLAILLHSYNLWCNTASELFQFLADGINELEQKITVLEKMKVANNLVS